METFRFPFSEQDRPLWVLHYVHFRINVVSLRKIFWSNFGVGLKICCVKNLKNDPPIFGSNILTYALADHGPEDP